VLIGEFQAFCLNESNSTSQFTRISRSATAGLAQSKSCTKCGHCQGLDGDQGSKDGDADKVACGERDIRMRKWHVIYGSVIGALAIALGAMLWLFVLAGKTTVVAEDRREAVVLEPAERALILAEMRGFLSAVQAIAAGVARDDPAAIAQAARPHGMAAAGAVPATVVAKLPIGFKQIGHGVHHAFDRIAIDAETMGDSRLTLSQLAETLGRCVACHNIYQLAPPGAK